METYSFKYYLKKPISIEAFDKQTKYKIYGRLIINRKKAEFYTNFSVTINDWDIEKDCLKNNVIIKEDLVDYEQSILNIRRNFIAQGIKPTASQIINAFKNKDNPTESNKVLNFFQKCLNDMDNEKRISRGTILHYKGTHAALKSFCVSINKEQIAIGDIDYTFIKKYDFFLAKSYKAEQEKALARNTINKYHSRFRTILNIAIKENLIKNNPYHSFPLKNTKSNRTYLSPDELIKFKEADIGYNKSLDRIRDIFLFSCNTGLRFSDAMKLKMTDIKRNKANKPYIEIISTKTKDDVLLPLTRDAIEIIEKYESNNDRIVHNFILPQISNQKFNTYLKVIGSIANIEKDITHHVARHTFATIALNNGIPIEVVQKLLSHTDIKTTQIYAKLLTETVFKEMEKMD